MLRNNRLIVTADRYWNCLLNRATKRTDTGLDFTMGLVRELECIEWQQNKKIRAKLALT